MNAQNNILVLNIISMLYNNKFQWRIKKKITAISSVWFFYYIIKYKCCVAEKIVKSKRTDEK